MPTSQPKQHFAIGLPVRVRMKAVPAGWPEYEKFEDFDDNDYHRYWPIKSVCETNLRPGELPTFEVGGWYWYGTDLEQA